ncbi:MAG: Hpt domain-containing protein [Pirellulales bacterium]
MKGLQHRCMGNIAFLQRVLKTFQRQLPEDLAELDRMLELRDAEQLARVAHRIRGTSANVSAKGLQQAAAEVEALSNIGRVHDDDIAICVDHLRKEWGRYLDHTSKLFYAVDTA